MLFKKDTDRFRIVSLKLSYWVQRGVSTFIFLCLISIIQMIPSFMNLTKRWTCYTVTITFRLKSKNMADVTTNHVCCLMLTWPCSLVCRRWWLARRVRWWHVSPARRDKTWATSSWGRSDWGSPSSWRTEEPETYPNDLETVKRWVGERGGGGRPWIGGTTFSVSFIWNPTARTLQ